MNGASHWAFLFGLPLVGGLLASLLVRVLGEALPLVLPAVFVATSALLMLLVAACRAGQRRTAAALRLCEEQYQLLADNCSDLVIRLDRQGQADYVSSAAHRVLGLPPEALAGSALAARIHPDDHSRFAVALQRVRRVGEGAACFRMRHAGGFDRWIEAQMRLAPPLAADGGEVPPPAPEGWVIASLRDIHDRRTAELLAAESATRLRESNRLLMMAEELASLGHWVFDPARQELILSPEAATMIDRSTLAIAVPDALALLQPRDRLRLLRILTVARRAQAPFECTVSLDQGHGNRTLQLRMQLQGVDRSSSLFGVVSDITAKLEAEQQLITALDEARSAASFRSQFLATMSHEIRTPMTGVIGMIELLEADPEPADRRLYLQTLRQSGDLLMVVVNDILDFSKVDAGRVAIADEPFDLGATLLTTHRLFDCTATARGLHLRLEAPAPGALWLRGDAVRLRQVLSNLLSNAIKFSQRGEIVLRCEAAAAPHNRCRLQISVIDHGIGIGPALRARLFEPFVQGEHSATSDGTGLGLAISRRLVAAMGGSIAIRSQLGQGSTFTISLALPLSAPPAALPGNPEPPSHRSLAILLAEDNPVNQLLVTALCKRMGHRVTCAADGELAVAAAAERPFDLILMDMQMPRCDGLAAARRIRADPGPNAATPICALTADACPERRSLYAEAGLDALLTKPIDSRALARTLAELAPVPLAAAADPAPVADPCPGPPWLDTRTLDELRALLGANRLDQLLDLLLVELECRPSALRSALADRDFAAAAAEAHNLKGAAANLGAAAVGQAAGALERAIRSASEGDPRLLAAALRQLAAAATATRQAVDAMREEHGRQAMGA